MKAILKDRKITWNGDHNGINKIIQIELLNYVPLDDIRIFYYDAEKNPKETRFYQLIINENIENIEYKMQEIHGIEDDPKKYIVAQLRIDEKKFLDEDDKKIYEDFPINFFGKKNSQIIDHFNKNLVFLKQTASDININEFISIGGLSITKHCVFSTLGDIKNRKVD